MAQRKLAGRSSISNSEVIGARGAGLGTGTAGNLSIQIGWIQNGVLRMPSMDNQTDLPAALAYANANGYASVELAPGTVYTASSTLVVPTNVTLDGLGRGRTNAGIADVGQYRGIIRAAGGFSDPYLIRLETQGNIRGCVVDGDGNAATAAGVGLDSTSTATIHNRIEECLIMDVRDGIYCDAALYTYIGRNTFAQIARYGLNGVANISYYGINVGISELNEYKGATAFVKNVGILTSISDDFEGTYPLSGTEYLIQVGDGATQSEMNMFGPYFELYSSPGTATKVFHVENSSAITISGGQTNGDGSTGSIWMLVNAAGRISVHGHLIKDCDTVFDGTITTASAIDIAGNRVTNYVTSWSIPTNLNSAQSARVLLPDFVYGAKKAKTWSAANIANFEISEASHHVFNVTSGSHTISPGTYRNPGMDYVFEFVAANVTLGSGGTLDQFVPIQTPSAGAMLHFAVNYISRVQQVIS